MTESSKRTGDWDRTEWKGSTPEEATASAAVETTPRAEPEAAWVKTEWIGDQGDGAPGPVDPAQMPEGEHTISGDRHAPGVQHWAGGNGPDHEPATGDRPLKQG